MAHDARWHNGGDPDLDLISWWADCRCGWRYPDGTRGTVESLVQGAVDQHQSQ